MKKFLTLAQEQIKNKYPEPQFLIEIEPFLDYDNAMISALFLTRNDEVRLAFALSALVPAATEGVVREVIVVDQGSRDGTVEVADVAGCTIVDGAIDPLEVLRSSALDARGDWLLFLSPSSVLEPAWQGEALAFIDDAISSGKGRSRAACFRLGRSETGWRARLGEWVAAFRTRVLSAPSEENGLLISRAFYKALGGHRPLAAMANVELARRIGRSRLTILRARAMSRNAERHGGLARALRNAACLALFALRVSPRLIGRLAG